MNQRQKRARDRKRDNFVSLATGSHNTLRKTTGDMAGKVQMPQPKPQPSRQGTAKASPAFRAVKPTELPSADTQKKTLAENVVEPKKETKRESKAEARKPIVHKSTGDTKKTDNNKE